MWKSVTGLNNTGISLGERNNLDEAAAVRLGGRIFEGMFLRFVREIGILINRGKCIPTIKA